MYALDGPHLLADWVFISGPLGSSQTILPACRPEGRTHLKDVVVYDLETKQFDLTCPALPGEGRAHHTATAVDHKIWIIGGSGISDVFSDTLVFDTEKRAWRTYAFGYAGRALMASTSPQGNPLVFTGSLS